jgi:hypothetical protein
MNGAVRGTGGHYSPQGTSTICPTAEKYFWYRSGATSGSTRAASSGLGVGLEATVAEAGAASDFFSGGFPSVGAATGRASGSESRPTPGTLSPCRQALTSSSSPASHSPFSTAWGLGMDGWNLQNAAHTIGYVIRMTVERRRCRREEDRRH